MRQSALTPCSFAAFVAVAALVLTPPHSALAGAPRFEAPGSVTIMSTTTGAQVQVNGEVIGKIPLDDSIVLKAGVHRIRVSLRGWTEYVDTFEVGAGEDVELEIDLIPVAGIVRINTDEPGVTVKVDGKVEGVTPFDKDIAVGDRVVTLSRPGFHDEVRQLTITAGQEYVFDIAMRPLPVEVAAEGDAFYETWWFWTVIAVAGAGTATAIALSSGGETAAPSAAFTLQIP